MFENRRHFRLREFIDVAWKVTDQDVSGEGLVMNISSSGLLLQTDKVFRPSDDCILSIETGAGAENLPFAGKKGKLMWFKRIHTPQERFQCGIQFLANTDNNFQQWLEMKVGRLSEAGDATILGNLAF
jgi:Tfp pilus assembly protein PilZ